MRRVSARIQEYAIIAVSGAANFTAGKGVRCMELFLNIITVLEIIAVEFISIWKLSQRKHTFGVALGTYGGITAVLIAFMCFVAVHLPGYGNGSGRFMVLGLLYFLPALINYGGPWKSRIILAFYSFSYGLAGFAVAVRVGYLLCPARLSQVVFLVQTLFYALTLPVFLRFSRQFMVPCLQRADPHQKNLLVRYTIASFFLIIFYNNVMVIGGSEARRLTVYLLLIYFIVLTYRLMVSYLKADGDKQQLSALAFNDRLTGLGNRLALRDYGAAKLQAGEPFYLLFMDLNRFKSVNDTYGHTVGDEYLCAFARALQGMQDAVCFRFSGDEFVCFTGRANAVEEVRTLRVCLPQGMEFLGVAVGCAAYPQDGASLPALLEAADRAMYQDKKLSCPQGRR